MINTIIHFCSCYTWCFRLSNEKCEVFQDVDIFIAKCFNFEFSQKLKEVAMTTKEDISKMSCTELKMFLITHFCFTEATAQQFCGKWFNWFYLFIYRAVFTSMLVNVLYLKLGGFKYLSLAFHCNDAYILPSSLSAWIGSQHFIVVSWGVLHCIFTFEWRYIWQLSNDLMADCSHKYKCS